MCDNGEGREKPQLLSFFQQSQKGVVVITFGFSFFFFFLKKKLQGTAEGGDVCFKLSHLHCDINLDVFIKYLCL